MFMPLYQTQGSASKDRINLRPTLAEPPKGHSKQRQSVGMPSFAQLGKSLGKSTISIGQSSVQFMLTESEGFSRRGSQLVPEEPDRPEAPNDQNLIIVQEVAWSLTKSSESILSNDDQQK